MSFSFCICNYSITFDNLCKHSFLKLVSCRPRMWVQSNFSKMATQQGFNFPTSSILDWSHGTPARSILACQNKCKQYELNLSPRVLEQMHKHTQARGTPARTLTFAQERYFQRHFCVQSKAKHLSPLLPSQVVSVKTICDLS